MNDFISLLILRWLKSYFTPICIASSVVNVSGNSPMNFRVLFGSFNGWSWEDGIEDNNSLLCS